MSTSLQLETIPYEPLPQPAREAALAGIRHCGFSSKTILENYGFSSTKRKQTVNLNIHALAFAHPKNLNLSNASITLYNAVNGQNNDELVSLLAQSTAPFHIIHRDGQFAFMASTVRNKKSETIKIQSDISYDQIGRVLEDYASDLKPERIIEVKQGRGAFSHPLFRQIGPLQLSLWATEVNSASLVNVFGHAVAELRHGIETSYGPIASNDRKMKDTITDIAIQLLGATILADTGVLENDLRDKGASASLDEVLTSASFQFPNYFDPRLFRDYWDQAEAAYQLLRQIHYSGFLPEMLRELYLQAYSKEDRRRSGSFDTPLYLTRHIWKNIPVEYLRPEQRVAVDLTCGWGSFLIAGHERFSQLSDMRNMSLHSSLRGNDKYHLTARLAGLGLLLSTSEDRWHIDDEDALKWKWLNGNRPNIIVGNPPFRASRTLYKDKEESSENEQSKKEEAANQFLQHAIERLAPGGYLAMVMPRSFTVGDGKSTKQLRQQLLHDCDVQELLELPSGAGVFSEANPRALVVFAQKKQPAQKQSHFPVRLRSVQNGTLKKFQDEGIVTVSGLIADQSRWDETSYRTENGAINTHIMEYSLILPEVVWQQIHAHSVPLEKYAHIFRGAIVGTQRKKRPGKQPREVSWLANAGAVPESFHLHYDDPPEKKLYPNDFERARPQDEAYFERTKVLFVRAPDTSWGRRSKVAIERKGYYVSGSFIVVAPHLDQTLWTPSLQEAITNEVLAAIMYWDVGNAWIIEGTTSLGTPSYAIKTLPFPDALTVDDCHMLTAAVRRLEADDETAFEAIDSILRRAYRLDKATFKHLRQITTWNSKTQLIYDQLPNDERINCFVSGRVESVDAREGTIKLWIKGMEETQVVQIASSMPGWLLRPGAEFYTKIPFQYVEQEHIDPGSVDWKTFYPQMYTYLSEVELMEEFVELSQ